MLQKKLSTLFIFCFLMCLSAEISIAQPREYGATEPVTRSTQQDSIKCWVGTRTVTRWLNLNYGIRSGSEAQNIVEEVLHAAGILPGVVRARAAEVSNAEACRGTDGISYILYNPGWLSRLYVDSNEYWADRAVIAHELGHIWYNHSMVALGSNPTIELQADEYAGIILARMGATLEQAESAYLSNVMRTPEGTHDHPPTNDRVAAVERGWRSEVRSGANVNAPHVVPSSNGLAPAPGYAWLNNEPNDLRVRWNPGEKHHSAAHIVACQQEGNWCPEFGYKFVNNDPNDLTVRWQPGQKHPSAAHVITSEEEGNLSTEPGYSFTNNDPNDLSVRWEPGKAHPSHPHVVASQQEGQWHPESGYTWVDPNDPNNMDVKPIP